jgi:hypothetical protein
MSSGMCVVQALAHFLLIVWNIIGRYYQLRKPRLRGVESLGQVHTALGLKVKQMDCCRILTVGLQIPPETHSLSILFSY